MRKVIELCAKVSANCVPEKINILSVKCPTYFTYIVFMTQYSTLAKLQEIQWIALLFCTILCCGSPNSSLAQINKCDNVLMNETDSLTGENIIRSQRNIIISDDGGKTGFAILGILMDSTFILRIKTVGAGACVNYGDQIHFVFNDSSELRLTNMAQFNCEAQSSLYFNFKNNNCLKF